MFLFSSIDEYLLQIISGTIINHFFSKIIPNYFHNMAIIIPHKWNVTPILHGLRAGLHWASVSVLTQILGLQPNFGVTRLVY